MYTILRTAGLLLAVLFLFLALERVRIYNGSSFCNALGPWGMDFPPEVLMGVGILAVLVIFFWVLFLQRGGIWFGECSCLAEEYQIFLRGSLSVV